MIAVGISRMIEYYIESNFDTYQYKVLVIHCDGRERVVYATRSEIDPPHFNEIGGAGSPPYIPIWKGHKNVCDIEILDKKLIKKAI